MAVTNPELFVTQEMAGDVEVHGELTMGATVFDRRRVPAWRHEMIGSAAAGGAGFANFGQFALQSLASLLHSIGEIAIATGVGLESIKASLKSLGGAGAIAAGIAMIALASGIKTSLAKKADGMGGIPALAEGGIATGPTLALIGEGKGPEAVIPLDKLEGMMSGGMGQNVVVTGRLQGADLLISNERASRERSRYRGF
jgi:hypothetical protein